MTLRGKSSAGPATVGFGIVSIGVLVGGITVLGMNLARPAVLIVMFGGIILLLPTLMVRDPRAYWLFLLVTSIPFDIYKSLSRWIVAPEVLITLYGPPTAGNASLDFYLTDVVLLAMVLHWVVRLCLRRDRFYFPKFGHFFVLYLIWALIGALTEAESLFVASLEWCRQFLYFISFLYLINNVKTRAQLRTIVFALFVGLAIASGTVIAFAALDIGTDTKAFDAIFSERDTGVSKKRPGTILHPGTMYAISGNTPGDSKRSEGIFSHPALAAAYIGLTVPLALAFLAAARRWRDGILFGAFVVSGYVASYVTYSRAGLIALIFGSTVFVLVGRWSRLISRKWFILGVFMFALVAAVSVPLLISFLETRPASYYGRFDYAVIALESYWQRPILGTGLNNGSSAIKEAFLSLRAVDSSGSVPPSIPCHYLVILVEGGLVGFLLFFAFFGQIVIIAFRSMRAADTETKVVLAGIIGGLSSIALQNIADNPLAGHSTSALIWLLTGLTVVIARRVQSERVLSTPQHVAPAVPRLALTAASRTGARDR